MAFCTACGRQLIGGERFCGRCGAALPDAPNIPGPPASGAASTTAAPAKEPSGATSTTTAPARPEGSENDGPPADTPPPAETAVAGHSDVTAARWAVGSGPIPQPPRSSAARRTVILFGLPVVLLAAGLVGLIALIAALRSGPDLSDAVPKIATPLESSPAAPTGTAATATAPGPSVTSGAATSTPLTGSVPPAGSAVPQITATTALQQAHAVEELLDAAARTPVAATVASLARCDPTTLDASTAATTLQSAASSRDELLRRLQDIPVDKLADGPTAKAALRETWTQWQAADKHYLTWAQGLVSGAWCNPQDPFKLAGDVAAGAARRAGTEFVATWNAKVARPLHLPARQVRNL